MVDTLFNAASMYIAFSWILNALFLVSRGSTFPAHVGPRFDTAIYAKSDHFGWTTYLSAFRWKLCPGIFDRSTVNESSTSKQVSTRLTLLLLISATYPSLLSALIFC